MKNNSTNDIRFLTAFGSKRPFGGEFDSREPIESKFFKLPVWRARINSIRRNLYSVPKSYWTRIPA